jgi:hypothetical protein
MNYQMFLEVDVTHLIPMLRYVTDNFETFGGFQDCFVAPPSYSEKL